MNSEVSALLRGFFLQFDDRFGRLHARSISIGRTRAQVKFRHSDESFLRTSLCRIVATAVGGVMLRAFVLTAAVLGFSASAGAQLIVGNDQSGSASIYDVNPTTGVATPIYTSTGSDAKPWGMAYDGTTNTLYWNNGSTLYSSPFGPTLTPTNLGSMTFNGAAVNFVGLGFRDGNLYGTRNITTEAVYEIKPSTREATQVYVYSSTFDFGGVDVDSTNNELYGLTDTPTATKGLYRFNIPGQSEAFLAPYPAGETDIDGLAVHNGLAYYVTDGPNTTQPNFYVFNVSTGLQVGTIPSPFTLGGTFSAATWAVIPEPTFLALPMLAAVALARRSRSVEGTWRRS